MSDDDWSTSFHLKTTTDSENSPIRFGCESRWQLFNCATATRIQLSFKLIQFATGSAFASIKSKSTRLIPSIELQSPFSTVRQDKVLTDRNPFKFNSITNYLQSYSIKLIKLIQVSFASVLNNRRSIKYN